MKYRQLGTTGVMVSQICLGTMTFGAGEWGCDEKTSHGIIDTYLQGGGNFIDTADVYAGGKSETIIGTYLKTVDREDIFLATKTFFPAGERIWDRGLSKKHIVASVDASLKRLGTDYIDLYYVHGYDPRINPEALLDALLGLVDQGKVLYLAASNWFAWQFARFQGLCAERNRPGLVALQNMYNLVNRESEYDVIPALKEYGVSLIPWSPLAGGLLTGKYRGQETPAKGSRLDQRSALEGPRFWHPHGIAVAETVSAVAAECGIHPVSLSLGWILSQPTVSSVIVGSKSPEQIRENMQLLEQALPAEIVDEIDKKTSVAFGYLTEFQNSVMTGALNGEFDIT